MALTPENLQTLKAAFPFADHKFLRGFVYLKEDAITDRIEQVDPAWSFEIQEVKREHHPLGIQCVCRATLTICGVSRSNIGMQEVETSKDGTKLVGEVEKGSTTDALRRCARLFGIGRYLLDAPKEDKGFAAWLAAKQKETGAAPVTTPLAVVQSPSPTSTPTPPNGALNKSGVQTQSEFDAKQVAANNHVDSQDGRSDGRYEGQDARLVELFGESKVKQDDTDLYEVVGLTVQQQGESYMYIFKTRTPGVNITQFSRAAFRTAGFSVETWQKDGYKTAFVPAIKVRATLNGNTWKISEVSQTVIT